MKEQIKIPPMGESLTEASIGQILKPTGAQVAENDEIIELETEKVNQVLYAPIDGVVTWRVQEGDTVQSGDVIGEVDSEKAPTAEEEEKKEPAKEEKKEKVAPSKPATKGGARKMQAEFVSELKAPPPKAPKKEEPEPAAASPDAGRESRKKMSKMRKTIASRLVDALHTSAMLTTFNEVDMSAVIELRTRYKESFQKKHGVKLGFMSFFVKACVEALKEFPGFNSYIDGEDLVHREYYDIGIAVGTERGLVVPVVRNCDELTFAEIEKEIAAYAQKAREGGLQIADLQGGGFTITNGGVYGSLLSTPILNPPQAGILGMHAIQKRPVAHNDEVVVRPMMYLALSYDHRVVDGKEAVTFLVRVKEILEDPSRLMLLETES